MVVYTLTPVLQPWEVEARGPKVQCHPQLHTEFKDTLEYIRSCFSTQANEGFQVFYLNEYDCFSF